LINPPSTAGVSTPKSKFRRRRNVIEYSGELVNPVESYWLTKERAETYAFKHDEFWCIDGAVGRSGAQFINHSCEPNLRWQKLGVRVMCQSIRPIAAGEELTLDYNFSSKCPKVPCRCGSPKCRGLLMSWKMPGQKLEQKNKEATSSQEARVC
jgi:SET domain-containing protein